MCSSIFRCLVTALAQQGKGILSDYCLKWYLQTASEMILHFALLSSPSYPLCQSLTSFNSLPSSSLQLAHVRLMHDQDKDTNQTRKRPAGLRGITIHTTLCKCKLSLPNMTQHNVSDTLSAPWSSSWQHITQRSDWEKKQLQKTQLCY